MASTSPFPPADPTAQEADQSTWVSGRLRVERRGARTAGSGARARKQALLESMVPGLPSWKSLQPVLLFLIVPAAMAFGIVISGGHWPKEVLYTLAVCIGLYVALSAFRGVELILACSLFYLPFSSTYVIPLAPGINGTNVLILLGLFASVLQAADQRHSWISWPRGTTLVFLFAVFSAASGLTAAAQPGGISYLLHDQLLNYKGWIDQFLLYFIALSCIRDTDTAKRIVIYMAIGSMVLVIYAVPEMLDKMGRSTIEKSRIEGPHMQSNNFGGFVAYTLLPLLAIFLTFIKDIRAWLLTPYFLLTAKVLISTFSRGAYLAMALGGFLAAYYKGRGFLIFWGTLALSFLLVFPSVMPESILARLQSITQSAPSTSHTEKLDKSSENRLILWRAAGKMILEDPITGKGFKYFPKLKSQYTESDVREADPHNMYLYIASQMGLPTLSLFLLILLYSFHLGRLLSRNREDRFIRAIGIGGAAATACYATICMFGSRAVNLEFSAYFWTYFVCMQVIQQQQVLALQAKAPKKQRTNAFAQRQASLESSQIQQIDHQKKDDSGEKLSSPVKQLPSPARRRATPLSPEAGSRASRRRLNFRGKQNQ